MGVAANMHITRDKSETATPPLVALPERYRYILRRDRSASGSTVLGEGAHPMPLWT
jgi:hypothetical protein